MSSAFTTLAAAISLVMMREIVAFQLFCRSLEELLLPFILLVVCLHINPLRTLLEFFIIGRLGEHPATSLIVC